MNSPRYRFLFSILLTLLLAVPAAPFFAAGGAHGGRSGGGTASRSGGGYAGRAGGSGTERHFGAGGGLNRSHGFHGSTRVFVGWPWWGAGWGWGWGYGWPSYYGYWGGAYYPGYGPYYPGSYYRSAPPDSVGTVELHVSPRKASVRLDGYDVGQARDYNDSYTPLFLSRGDHVIELTYDGFKTLRVRVRGTPGASLYLRYDLEKGEGLDPRSETARIGPPQGDREDEYEETPPEPPRGPKPSPRDRDRDRDQDRRDQDRDMRPAPEQGPTGFVRIRVEPGDAAVYLDGDFLGKADELGRLHGPISVRPGSHRLEAVRPGFEAKTVTLKVREGDTETVRLDLSSAKPERRSDDDEDDN